MPIRRLAPGRAAVRYGFIGPGTHAQENLLPALSVLDGARLTAVAARKPDAAAEAARRWGADLWTDDWTELTEPADGEGGREVDALVVAGSPDLHAEVLRRALPAASACSSRSPGPRHRDAGEAGRRRTRRAPGHGGVRRLQLPLRKVLPEAP